MSKTLYLIRHAKSDWHDKSISDFDRPLNARGEHDAPVIGKELQQRGVIIDAMISSPAKRALMTSIAIATALLFPLDKIQQDERIYDNTVHDLMNVLMECDDIWDNVMLVGHNPAFTLFATQLCRQGVMDFPTCGVCGITFDVDTWMDATASVGRCQFTISPKD